MNYPALDHFNFDAQAESFLWLASGRGIAIDSVKVPRSRHNLAYIERAELPAYRWLGQHLPPPRPR